MRVLLACVLLAACGPTGMSGPTMNNSMASPAVASATVESTEILDREPRTNQAKVKHILIGWDDKAGAYRGDIDPRAAKRSRAEAEREVRALQKQLAAGADWDQLMKA